MGSVYRARDTRLGREVAIKISAEHFTERFAREARAIAALNHPNICQLYDVGPDYLVMELVDGQPLLGPMPLDKALDYARQIIDALDAAHEKGIIHRDLKPSNILVLSSGTIKLLDFGLAKTAEEPPADPRNSPTMTMSPTRAGMILGTAAYMAPEQARGLAVDKRVDIWAFGCVLYELLTGKQAFQGNTVSDILAAVLKDEPDYSNLPAHLRTVIEKCLRKDPRKRWRDIGDVRLALDEPAAVELAPTRPRWWAIPWVISTLLAVALGFALIFLAARPIERPVMRLAVDLGPDAELRTTFTTFALSPDGKRLVFGTKSGNGAVHLAVRQIDQGNAVALPGTEGARDPFFSPDGEWIGFSADGKLKKVSVTGGVPGVLCDAPNFRGASWSESGYIVAALNTQGGLVRIPEAGGTPQPVTELSKEPHEISHRWPQMLPKEEAVLFTSSVVPNFREATIVAQSLKTGERKILWKGGTFGRYVSSGHLLFFHEGTLLAARMDPISLRLTTQPVPVLEGISVNTVTGSAAMDCSRDGVFIFEPGDSVQSHALYWRTSSAPPELLTVYPGAYAGKLAPDGRRLALTVADGAASDVWVYDIERGARTRLTFDGMSTSNLAWSPDGKYVVYLSFHDRRSDLIAVRADGTGERVKLYSSQSYGAQPGPFSPDGRHFVFMSLSSSTGLDILMLPIEKGPSGELTAGPAEPLIATRANEQDPDISPDGRWLAYVSDETGRQEVYVRPFPEAGGRWQVSTEGGSFPLWSRAGHELFFIAADHMMVAPYDARGASFESGKPSRWSDQEFLNPSLHRMFDGMPDGKRFIELRPLNPSSQNRASSELTFIVNFFQELNRTAPRK
jgi:serine/threonine-protein kinase